MGSSNVSEDGTSERVRFDNTVYYSMDEAIEKVCISIYADCIGIVCVLSNDGF